MIKIFGLAIWTAKDVRQLDKAISRMHEVVTELNGESRRYMKRSEKMFSFIMRNLPLKRKRKVLRRMLAEAK